MKKTIALTTAFCLLFNSCYFNSAGHLFTKGAYKASADSSDAKVGKHVYAYHGEYYVELPRYRKGKKVLTQYAAWDKDNRQVGPQPTGDVTLFKIPADFAMYLTGTASAPSVPGYMTPVKNAADVKQNAARLSIVRAGGASSHDFQYDSPNAVWWYTAGVFEWLCVDLPITITENALVTSGFIAMLALALASGNSRNSGATSAAATSTASTASTTTSNYSSSYDSGSSYSSTCPVCDGTGSVKSESSGYTPSNTFFLTRKKSSSYTTCPHCSGTGTSDTCPTCGGSGKARSELPSNNTFFLTRRNYTCPDCHGTGRM